MQIAFVLPLSMPLLLPVSLYRLNWFFPAMMILLGAHYLPFVFLYGMRMFAVLRLSSSVVEPSSPCTSQPASASAHGTQGASCWHLQCSGE